MPTPIPTPIRIPMHAHEDLSLKFHSHPGCSGSWVYRWYTKGAAPPGPKGQHPGKMGAGGRGARGAGLQVHLACCLGGALRPAHGHSVRCASAHSPQRRGGGSSAMLQYQCPVARAPDFSKACGAQEGGGCRPSLLAALILISCGPPERVLNRLRALGLQVL